MRANSDSLHSLDVTYFAASVDTPETNKDFAESVDADYPILSDPGKAVARAYGVVTDERELPYRWTFYIGGDGNILRVDREVSTTTAGEDVVATLKDLGVQTRQ